MEHNTPFFKSNAFKTKTQSNYSLTQSKQSHTISKKWSSDAKGRFLSSWKTSKKQDVVIFTVMFSQLSLLPLFLSSNVAAAAAYKDNGGLFSWVRNRLPHTLRLLKCRVMDSCNSSHNICEDLGN